jgi:hypothetical protein
LEGIELDPVLEAIGGDGTLDTAVFHVDGHC